ncbi:MULTISPECIES: tRNA uridine-5-carboxymethylaminomethyl(34) synthesis GTPase MnmE [unclassified Sinorhizobium]|uniref:tRNA uridine-5-carboxymethylaminomethyl(34) synthesis GTPase MnmE n=1 Tax=unclassified Sinorhizobium TaxID=2613772 RepID=UPI0035234048
MTIASDTIFALSSGGLPSGVAVIRISGPRAFEAARALLRGELPPPRTAALRTIRTRNGLILDRALILIFPNPASFTGEDCVELHLHGGRAVIKALFDELGAAEGLRLAEAGEFSRRAFENGKLDLVEAEGLADLISAETEMQRRLAVEQSAGGLSALYDGWADRLTRARALIEAELDFADEEDVPGSVSEQAWDDMQALNGELADHLSGAAAGEIIRDGLKVVIGGPPNAGKSSLMNALAKRDIAIVTDIAGTTRDVLHVDLDIDGFAVRLYDTAGLRETEEVVEREGVRRAQSIIEHADLLLLLEEIGKPTQAAVELEPPAGNTWRIGTKVDLYQGKADDGRYDLRISTTTGAGLLQLQEMLGDELKKRTGSGTDTLPGRLRHTDNLRKARYFLERAVSAVNSGLDIRAEDLRLAGNALGRITGRVDVENLLDVIFSEFCIGK